MTSTHVRRLIATSCLIVLGIAGTAAAQLDFPPPVAAEVRVPPAPLPAQGNTYLCYELTVSNFAPVDEVYTDDATAPALTHQGDELKAALLQPAAMAKVEPGVVRAGGFEVVYLWLVLAGDAHPSTLRNVVNLEAAADMPVKGSVESVVDVAPADTVAKLGPPLRGGPWVMAHGFDNINGHRRIYVPLLGRANVPQRYAIDYFMVNDKSESFSGDEKDVESHFAYGHEVLAVADGVVAVARDGIPDNTPSPYERAVPINLETVAGNHVLLDIGGGRYGFYAHFKPGSLRVKQGDRVKRGDVIALLGNSGNTPAPHLHFTVADSTAILANEGLPYVFSSFEVVGECSGKRETWGWFDSCTFTEPDPRHDEIPLAWQLIRFPE